MLRSLCPFARLTRTWIVFVLCVVGLMPSTPQAQTGTVKLTPEDTYLNLDSRSYSTATTLSVFTWPDYKPSNATLLKFDLSTVPAGAVITKATLSLALVGSDRQRAPYTVSAHRVRSGNPVIARATGFTTDGTRPWTASTCCSKGIPLAQADIDLAEDSQDIDRVNGFKSWTITAMVSQWLANPGSNFGVLLNADTTVTRNRYRSFASANHSDAGLRPYLTLTFQGSDVVRPAVQITSPGSNATLSQTAALSATATDNVGVASVQFMVDNAPIGGPITAAPYAVSWATSTVADGAHTLTAVARDGAGNTATSAGVPITVKNGAIVLSPQDTTLNINTTNYSTDAALGVYTWPDNKLANSILMKFDVSKLPAGSVIEEATLYMALVDSDAAADSYTMTAHKITGKNPNPATATGMTADGTTSWTASSCCYNNVPLAQSDIAFAVDTRAVTSVAGFKTWTITSLVQDWVQNPAANFGLLLNGDATKPRDRYREFASMEHADSGLRPYLLVKLTAGSGGGPDTTAPVVSGAAASALAPTTATITWTTNEASNTQVEYGTTTAYGQTTALNATLLTSHAATITGLNASTKYYFRARSRDQAGNLGTSASLSFTTPALGDITAPNVTLSAPQAGATVTGTATIAATASDNVGVAGVQFRVDGTALGAEDTTSPYSASWNTTAVANGSHTLTAVARDGAGNVRTSSAVTVTVNNAATSTGSLSEKYPGDAGIEGDPKVVFVERFDETSLTSLFANWSDVRNGAQMSFSNDVPAGSTGRSLNIPMSSSVDGGHLYRPLTPGVSDTLYVRYYIKYPTVLYDHSGVWIGGTNPVSSWPDPQAGTRPVGNDRFIAAAEQNPVKGKFDHYDYWMNMRLSADGNYWGNELLDKLNVDAPASQWVCVEQMVKLNNPVSASNGEHAIWLNGVKVSHLGQGFPNGSWSGGVFHQDPNGTPFEGFRWRSDANLNLNWIWLQNYSPEAGSAGTMLFDHLVVATAYIGCLTGASGGPSTSDATAPTVSMSSPSAGGTVTGTITASATASDNVGVAGVQFKLDGANIGSEDTVAPYSISWDSRTAPNGSHVLAAVARDAAGNTRTSTGVTITVSNATAPPASWPNKPAGLTTLTEWGLDQALPTSGDVLIPNSPGWYVVENAASGSSRGWTQLATDPSAPASGPGVYDFVYPQGMVEGNAPATLYHGGLNTDEAFVGFWWKASSPFDPGPNGNKIAFLFNGGGGAGGQQFLILMPDGKIHLLPEYPGDYRWRTPNVNATTVALGVWHRVEWYVQLSTGTVKWWLDGVLQGSYTDVTNSYDFDEFKFSPTWGGNSGARKTQTDHYWFDHVHISVK